MLQSSPDRQPILLDDGNCWTIGRGAQNFLVLQDNAVSRNHAMLQQNQGGEFYLIDLGSRNGSFVNDRQVNVPVILKNGDRLTFGKTTIEFHCPSHPPASAPDIDELDADASATSTNYQRRLMTILVVDIRDFTVLTRQLEETVLSEMMGNWFRNAGEIIRTHGSWVDKYIGDALMAVWIHAARETSPVEMLQILQALRSLHQMTQELSQAYPLPAPLRLGAGINTGYAMVGNAGSGDRPDYTALGDTVNAAFRLESATKQIGFDIVIGATTHQHLVTLEAEQPQFQERTVHLKGYDTPRVIYACSFADLGRLQPSFH